MTSPCSLFGVGTHVVGPLPDFWASGKPVGLGNGTFWAGWLGGRHIHLNVHFPLAGQFRLEKRAFSTENQHFPWFFGLFLTSDEAWP